MSKIVKIVSCPVCDGAGAYRRSDGRPVRLDNVGANGDAVRCVFCGGHREVPQQPLMSAQTDYIKWFEQGGKV